MNNKLPQPDPPPLDVIVQMLAFQLVMMDGVVTGLRVLIDEMRRAMDALQRQRPTPEPRE